MSYFQGLICIWLPAIQHVGFQGICITSDSTESVWHVIISFNEAFAFTCSCLSDKFWSTILIWPLCVNKHPKHRVGLFIFKFFVIKDHSFFASCDLPYNHIPAKCLWVPISFSISMALCIKNFRMLLGCISLHMWDVLLSAFSQIMKEKN